MNQHFLLDMCSRQTRRKKVFRLLLRPKQQLLKVRTMMVTGPSPPHGIWGTILEFTYNINLAKLWWTAVCSTHACGQGRKEGVEGGRMGNIPTLKYIYRNKYIHIYRKKRRTFLKLTYCFSKLSESSSLTARPTAKGWASSWKWEQAVLQFQFVFLVKALFPPGGLIQPPIKTRSLIMFN